MASTAQRAMAFLKAFSSPSKTAATSALASSAASPLLRVLSSDFRLHAFGLKTIFPANVNAAGAAPVSTPPEAAVSIAASRIQALSTRFCLVPNKNLIFQLLRQSHARRLFSSAAASRQLQQPRTISSFDTTNGSYVHLPRNSNQARGIAKYAIEFLSDRENNEKIDKSVYDKACLFHTDSALCGVSAIALHTNAPTLLREEALDTPKGQMDDGACVFGSLKRCRTEKAIAANCAAVREWDANGTVFGYNKFLDLHRKGEFGHNDFYPVVIAAAQAGATHVDGELALKAMICLDEIRGRLAEVFSLKTYKIDHVVYGAVAAAAVYGALMGASIDMIESAIGMTVAHYVPWRAIRAGAQLSDSKGASAALSTEAAILSVKRAMRGFNGPRDIFRNPESLFRWNEKTEGNSPFDLILSREGNDFAVSHMHFKLGLYEHQSAGALEGFIRLLLAHPQIYEQYDKIKQIKISAYKHAYAIIGDPAKRDPQTRQSADHSMVYIIATTLRKAIEQKHLPATLDDAWCTLLLTPYDYSKSALFNTTTRRLMEKVQFEHGGTKYDEKYPEGLPTSVLVVMEDGSTFDSGMVLFPTGHARNVSADLRKILQRKFCLLAEPAMDRQEAQTFIDCLQNLRNLSHKDLDTIYYYQSLNEPHHFE